MKRNKLAEQIKEQQELLVNLQEQVDAPVDFIMMINMMKEQEEGEAGRNTAVSDNVFVIVFFNFIINRWTHLSLELFPPLAEQSFLHPEAVERIKLTTESLVFVQFWCRFDEEKV